MCTALKATACRNAAARRTYNLRCPSPMIISMTNIKVGYATHSCVGRLPCPLQELDSSNNYSHYLLTLCNRQPTCEISTETLYTNFANEFETCPHGGKVRNIVEVTYFCVIGMYSLR